MRKAGTAVKITRNELKPPAWLSVAQLLFAAIMLYVIRNPLPLESDNRIEVAASNPAIVVRIPPSATTVAAPAKPTNKEFSM